jgi:hypothetical protein
VRAAEIVVHELNVYGVGVILDFWEKAFVSLVNLWFPIRMVRFVRSTYEVEMSSGSGLPMMELFSGSDAHRPTVEATITQGTSINLDQHHIIHVAPEGPIYGVQIGHVSSYALRRQPPLLR